MLPAYRAERPSGFTNPSFVTVAAGLVFGDGRLVVGPSGTLWALFVAALIVMKCDDPEFLSGGAIEGLVYALGMLVLVTAGSGPAVPEAIAGALVGALFAATDWFVDAGPALVVGESRRAPRWPWAVAVGGVVLVVAGALALVAGEPWRGITPGASVTHRLPALDVRLEAPESLPLATTERLPDRVVAVFGTLPVDPATIEVTRFERWPLDDAMELALALEGDLNARGAQPDVDLLSGVFRADSGTRLIRSARYSVGEVAYAERVFVIETAWLWRIDLEAPAEHRSIWRGEAMNVAGSLRAPSTGLSRLQVLTVFADERPALGGCWLGDPAQPVWLNVVIAPSGAVERVDVGRAHADIPSDIAACVAGKVAAWRFPAFEASPMNVRLPLVL